MQNSDLIKEIKESFEILSTQKNKIAIEESVRSITRSINRLSTDKSDLNLYLKKVAADLTSLHANQLQYWELRSKTENPGLKVKPEFDESFFKSLEILKTELYVLLDQL